MSISKLLMTAAICTMSMSVSMSFGAFESKLNEGDHTASASSLTSLSSSGFRVGKSGKLGADVRSVGSSMSTINPERLVPALKKIMGVLKNI
ncbi:MAG: hypothetical protein Q8R43_00670, partial [Alphaproteobacteria bacterium]|nr:hypothetical protein [Alphaproteobacteria bacterium]